MAMKFCPKCGNARTAKFCSRCGFAFPLDDAQTTQVAVTVVGPEVTTTQVYGQGYSESTHCRNCGEPRTKTAKVCKLCSADLS